MCRAIWVVVVAATDDAAKRLRRAAGADVQVVGIATSAGEASALLETRADVVLVDGGLDDAAALVAEVRTRAPDAAVVWIGGDPPADAHHAVAWDDDLADTLPSGITKALLARKR